LGQKKYTDAEPLLIKGYQGMKQRTAKIPEQFPHASPNRSRGTAGATLRRPGQEEEAAKWRKELEKTRKSAKTRVLQPDSHLLR
jgi:eukaryotic-like serine/threonine-protein kinase